MSGKWFTGPLHAADDIGGAARGAEQSLKQLANIPEMTIDSVQFGKKVGKHAQDFGLDAADPSAREWILDRIRDIRVNADEIRQGSWHPRNGGGTDYYFFKEGADVVLTNGSGEFVTILKGGLDNGWFKDATQLHP